MDETSLQPSNLTLARTRIRRHARRRPPQRGNPTQPAVGPFSYSYGFQFFAGGVHYHDIMSYAYPAQWNPDIGIPYFANPAVTLNGATGPRRSARTNEADLATTFIQTGPVVGSYRSTAVSDSTGPVASIYEVDPNGQA